MTTDVSLQQPLGLPGIDRDQTALRTQNWVDGLWTRFYNGDPRSIGGYIVCNFGTPEICRGMFGVPTGTIIGTEANVNTINLYNGNVTGVFFFPVNDAAQSLGVVNVTPLTYVDNPLNLWDFDQFTVDPGGGDPAINYILSHVSPSSSNINTIAPGFSYYGINGAFDPFLTLVDSTLNGFICVVAPFIFIGGQDGILIWNDPGTLTFPIENSVAYGNTRLVKGLPIRGGSVQSLLIWSLSSLYRVTYNPNTTEVSNTFFKEDISTNLSIISANSVIEIPEISTYVWIGRNCFYQYNGIVKELPNRFNKQWFFNNLNRKFQERCWALHVPKYNEVWFNAPFGDSEECTHTAVWNYGGDFWYDTINARSAGISSQYLSFPIMSDAQFSNPFITTYGEVYSFWMHEFGNDLQVDGSNFAIRKYLRSRDMRIANSLTNQDYQSRTRRFEADMFLDGQLTLQIYSKQFPGSPYEISRQYLLRDPVTNIVGKTDIVQLGRINSYYFESNQVGGFFQFGASIIDIRPDSSERPAH